MRNLTIGFLCIYLFSGLLLAQDEPTYELEVEASYDLIEEIYDDLADIKPSPNSAAPNSTGTHNTQHFVNQVRSLVNYLRSVEDLDLDAREEFIDILAKAIKLLHYLEVRWYLDESKVYIEGGPQLTLEQKKELVDRYSVAALASSHRVVLDRFQNPAAGDLLNYLQQKITQWQYGQVGARVAASRAALTNAGYMDMWNLYLANSSGGEAKIKDDIVNPEAPGIFDSSLTVNKEIRRGLIYFTQKQSSKVATMFNLIYGKEINPPSCRPSDPKEIIESDYPMNLSRETIEHMFYGYFQICRAHLQTLTQNIKSSNPNKFELIQKNSSIQAEYQEYQSCMEGIYTHPAFGVAASHVSARDKIGPVKTLQQIYDNIYANEPGFFNAYFGTAEPREDHLHLTEQELGNPQPFDMILRPTTRFFLADTFEQFGTDLENYCAELPTRNTDSLMHGVLAVGNLLIAYPEYATYIQHYVDGITFDEIWMEAFSTTITAASAIVALGAVASGAGSFFAPEIVALGTIGSYLTTAGAVVGAIDLGAIFLRSQQLTQRQNQLKGELLTGIADVQSASQYFVSEDKITQLNRDFGFAVFGTATDSLVMIRSIARYFRAMENNIGFQDLFNRTQSVLQWIDSKKKKSGVFRGEYIDFINSLRNSGKETPEETLFIAILSRMSDAEREELFILMSDQNKVLEYCEKLLGIFAQMRENLFLIFTNNQTLQNLEFKVLTRWSNRLRLKSEKKVIDQQLVFPNNQFRKINTRSVFRKGMNEGVSALKYIENYLYKSSPPEEEITRWNISALLDFTFRVPKSHEGFVRFLIADWTVKFLNPDEIAKLSYKPWYYVTAGLQKLERVQEEYAYLNFMVDNSLMKISFDQHLDVFFDLPNEIQLVDLIEQTSQAPSNYQKFMARIKDFFGV